MDKCKKGIILAGGTGSRLFPMTMVVNKHLIPVFDKPMVYFPLTTLMLAGIKEILLITDANNLALFKNLLGDGSQWGISIDFAIQNEPRGLADAFIVGKKFVDDGPAALILGDNIYHGQGLSTLLTNTAANISGAHFFAVRVNDPERFGVVELDNDGVPISFEEKPLKPKSNMAVTGLYFYDHNVTEYVKKLKPSLRGELEITDLNQVYLESGKASVTLLNRGISWFDMGTPSSLLRASNYVEIIQLQQSLGVAIPEEVAWRMKYISNNDLTMIIECLPTGEYKQYLKMILSKEKNLEL